MNAAPGAHRGAGEPGIARFHGSIGEIDAQRWNRLAGSAQPFLRHEFLSALEESGSVSPRSGWTARHLVLEDRAGRPLGAMPLYEKMHSRGEFVFDFSWANSYAHHGLSYYPKLLCAVPFTPATGPRLLLDRELAPASTGAALAAAVARCAREEAMSSAHVLFATEEQATQLQSAGWILRRDCQFHWINHGYESFDAFLATFTAEKRKKAKRERRRVAEAGISFDTVFGADIDARLWRVLYGFYADTFHRHGHEPYLNLDFFQRVSRALPASLMAKVARQGNEPIAVALFFVGEETLWGRYWGAGGNYHSLHFEACYYQGIEFCIERGLRRFEPGTQGEHKVPRGFVPTLTQSAHDIVDPRFAPAIREFAAREAQGVREYAAAVDEHVPYQRARLEELRL